MALPTAKLTLTTRFSWSYQGDQIVAGVTGTEDVGTKAIENVQVIGSASEAIDLGDVTQPSHLFFKNAAAAFSSLTPADQALYPGDPNANPVVTPQQDYDAENKVYISLASPATALNATVVLKPQQGVALVAPAAAWYAIRATNDVPLLVAAVQAP